MKYLIIMFPYVTREKETRPEYIDPETLKVTPAKYITVNKTHEDTEDILDRWDFTGSYKYVRSANDALYTKGLVDYQVFCIPADRVKAKLKEETSLSAQATDKEITDFLAKEQIELDKKQTTIHYGVTEDIEGWCVKEGYKRKMVEEEIGKIAL